MSNKYRGIIWDFNGTLLDDVTICIESINSLLKRRNFPLLSREQYKDIFDFPVKDYYEKIGFDFTKEQWISVANEYMLEYWNRQHQACLFKEIPQLLHQFSSEGFSLFVLSAMEQNNLQRFLSNLNVSHYFQRITGITNNLADGKIESGLKMMSESQLRKEELVLIGDTTHDFVVAEKMGIDCILFSGGHQSARRLQKLPCPIIEKHSELSNILIAKN